MFKASTALFLYAETSLHPGSGASAGAIDLAIQRERYTGFPCVAAQGVKGPVRDWFEHALRLGLHGVDGARLLSAFGPSTDNASDHAGAVAFTDARILLFPVRSMKGVFAWITCPFVLGRLYRDLALAQAGAPPAWQVAPTPGEALGAVPEADHACATRAAGRGAKVLLEEEAFTYRHSRDEGAQRGVGELARWLAGHAFPDAGEYAFWRDRLASHLLVVSDDDFRHFVRTTTEVQARVKLGEGKSTDTKKGGHLFYQENLPADTMLYSVVLAAGDLSGRLPAETSAAASLLSFVRTLDRHRLQIGGDETTGKGYVYASFLRGDAAGAAAPRPQDVEVAA